MLGVILLDGDTAVDAKYKAPGVLGLGTPVPDQFLTSKLVNKSDGN